MSHVGSRRRAYSGRRHQVDTRPAPSVKTEPRVKWWRMPDGRDHAFGGGATGFTRSACGSLPWSVKGQPWTFATPSDPCAGCVAVVGEPQVPAIEERPR